jgi:hypothetical protein
LSIEELQSILDSPEEAKVSFEATQALSGFSIGNRHSAIDN